MNDLKRRGSLLLLALASGWLLLQSQPTEARQKGSEEEPASAAVDAYVYGYSLVTMEYTRRVMTNAAEPKDNHAPMGQFYRARVYPDAKFRDVTAPNADTLYSPAWLDLSKEPYLLSLPDMGDRYFLMPMLDGWTNVFGVPVQYVRPRIQTMLVGDFNSFTPEGSWPFQPGPVIA